MIAQPISRHASFVERPTVAALIVLAFAVAIFALRLAGPNDLMDNDQERPAAYIADVLINNNWIVQVDDTGDVTSKPPVYTWLGAMAVLADGAFDRVTLYLPCGLAALCVAWLILGVGGRVLGVGAGLLGALVYLVSVPTIAMAALARTDPVFAATVGIAAMLAWRAWQTGGGWTWFWLAAAVATLTKGPLGLVLAAFGLLAVVWERRSGHRDVSLRGSHAAGIVLYLALCLGWLVAAYAVLGQPVLDKLLGKELVGHAVTSDSGKGLPLMKFYEPPLVFLARFAPWSLLVLVALWRVFTRPATDDRERRFERYLTCFFLGGLALFALSPHQRHVHQLPLMLAPALLAGREAARWIGERRWSMPAVVAALAVMMIAALLGFNAARARDEKVWETRQTQAMAERAVERFGTLYAVTIIDPPLAMQFHAGTFQRRVAFADAAAQLNAGTPMIVATRRVEKLNELLPSAATPLREIDAWPHESDERWLRLLTNTADADGERAAVAAALPGGAHPRVLATRPHIPRRVAVLGALLVALVGVGVWVGRSLKQRDA